MSKIYELRTVQRIPASLEEAWDFFSDPKNLMKITPPSLNLKVTNKLYGSKAYAGQIITYTVRPLLGIPMNWMTEIRHVEDGKMFVDEQRKGPYSLWHHQHHFREVDGGVEMTDIVHYRLPGWILGNLMHELLVKKKLKEIFDYRYQQVESIFGRMKAPATY